MPREIIQKIEINQSQNAVFNSLLEPSAIIEWWGAKTAIVIKEDNGIHAVTWGSDIDDPDYAVVSKIRNFNSNNKFSLEYMNYEAKTGKLPFIAEMITHFNVSQINVSNSLLEVNQLGIPDLHIADEYYEGCKKGWSQVLNNIKNYCERLSIDK